MNAKVWIPRIFLWKRFSSFAYLNTTQFLVTFNDSIFRLIVVFSLIDQLGKAQSSTILFITGVLFVAPFLVFSMPSGEVADKFPKQQVITATLFLEILAMGYGIYAMYRCSSFNAYASLFCVALQASIFLPSKYAILPEIVKKDDISRANGYMTLATYLAIIFGTFLASFFTQITSRNYGLVAIFCFIIALLGFYTSLQIEKTESKNPQKKINPLFLVQVYKSLKLAKQYPHLLLAVLASSYFLFTASFTQLNLIPFGLQSLHINDVQSSYVFLAAALGIGVGSVTVALISGKNVELGISIWGAFGTSISYIILFLMSSNLIVSILMILSLGVHGGLYIVPLDAYIQVASPQKDRGEIVAASSFLGFFGVLLAALSLGLFSDVLKLTAAEGYLIIGLLSLTVSTVITFFLPEYFSRILAVTLFKALYKIKTKNQPETSFYESIALIAKKRGFIEILSLIYLYPRISFIHFMKKKPWIFLRPFYRILHITTIPTNSDEAFKKSLQKAIELKMPLCFFLESKSKDPDHTKQALEKALLLIDIPKIGLQIHRTPAPASHGLFYMIKTLPMDIEANFSHQLTEKIDFTQATKLTELT